MKAKWGDFDLAARHAALHLFLPHEFAQRIPDRQHVGIDLLFQRAGQEAEFLARFDRWAGHDQALTQAGGQLGNAGRDSEKGLARAGRTDTEHEGIVRIGEQFEIFCLSARLGRDRLFQADQPAEGLCRGAGGFECAFKFHVIGLCAAANAALKLCERRFGNRDAFLGADEKNAAALAFSAQIVFGKPVLEQLEVAVMRTAQVLQPRGIADFENAADGRLAGGGLAGLQGHAAASRAETNSPVRELRLESTTWTDAIWPISSTGPLKCTACW